MDEVFQNKSNYINYIYNSNGTNKLVLSAIDIFYILLSNNPNDNESLNSIAKKILNCFTRNEYVTCDKKNLINLINFVENNGLNDEINRRIYELLELYETVRTNNMDISIIKTEINNLINLIINN